MALKDTLSVVLAELVAMGAITDSTLRLGPNVKGLRTVPPAIWFIPKDSSGRGPDAAATRATQVSLGNVPRPIHTRDVRLDVHIWAGGPASSDDYSAGELLLQKFLSALHHTSYGSYRFNGETWVSSGTDVITLGRRVIAHITISVPVLDIQPNAVSATNPTGVVLPESVVVNKSTQTDKMNNTTSETVG